MSIRSQRRKAQKQFNTMLKELYLKGRYYDKNKQLMFYAAGYLIQHKEHIIIRPSNRILYSTPDEKSLVLQKYPELEEGFNLLSIV